MNKQPNDSDFTQTMYHTVFFTVHFYIHSLYTFLFHTALRLFIVYSFTNVRVIKNVQLRLCNARRR